MLKTVHRFIGLENPDEAAGGNAEWQHEKRQ
jgi:hypothetical protein